MPVAAALVNGIHPIISPFLIGVPSFIHRLTQRERRSLGIVKVTQEMT